MNLVECIRELERLRLSFNVAKNHGPEVCCRDKKRFKKRGDAIQSKRDYGHEKEQDTYFCPFCYKWHNGRKMSKEEKEILPMLVSWEETIEIIKKM